MNYILLAVLGPFLLAATAQDPPPQDNTVVVAKLPPTFAQWNKRVTRQLDFAVRYPRSLMTGRVDAGVSSVRFHCDDKGVPTDVTLHRKSNLRAYDVAALQAIGRLKTLHPVPLSFRPHQRFQANIIFAASEYERDEVLATMKKDHARRVARYGAESDVIALSNDPRAPAPTSL